MRTIANRRAAVVGLATLAPGHGTAVWCSSSPRGGVITDKNDQAGTPAYIATGKIRRREYPMRPRRHTCGHLK